MSDAVAAAIAHCPAAAQPALLRRAAGEISAEIALTQLLLALGGAAAVTECLEGLAARLSEGGWAGELLRRARSDSAGLNLLQRLAEARLIESRAGNLVAIREQFDAAVEISPEGSVALYSLGSAATLERATGELVARLREWRLLGRDESALDIGCGIGRIEQALAGEVGAILGIDVSPAMIAEARHRCRGLANVDFRVCSGSDLAELYGRSFDLIVAVDSFPYLVLAGPEIAARHISDAARLLRPGGALAIFNYSYRGDARADRASVAAAAQHDGLEIERDGTRDFTLWDGVTFLLRKPAALSVPLRR